MSTNRRYTISCDKPGCPEDTLTGNWTLGPYDAAKNYAGLYLSGLQLITPRFVKVQDTEKHGLHSLWRAEAYDHEGGMGYVVWIREL